MHVFQSVTGLKKDALQPAPHKGLDFFRDRDFWKQQWEDKLSQYITEKPKLGVLIHEWITHGFITGVDSICEVAAGSCASSLYLSNFYRVTATDLYTFGFRKAREMASEGGYNLEFKKEDAFEFSFPSDTFDLVFHNGFFVLFTENRDIERLVSEQVRISKKYLLIAVHNRNDFLNRYLFYQKLRQGDRLYDIRWWSPREIVGILRPYGSIERIDYLSYPLVELAESWRRIPPSIRNNSLYRKAWELTIWKYITFGDRIIVLLQVKK